MHDPQLRAIVQAADCDEGIVMMGRRGLLRASFAYCLLAAVDAARAGSYEDFFIAAINDDVRTVRGLLVRGFDPNARNPQGQVALLLAIKEDSPKVVSMLLALPQLEVDASNLANETPLMMAALRGNIEVAKQLVERGAVISRPGWTPLHYAASGPSVEMVRWLIDRTVPVDARTPNGTTPLMLAAAYGPEETVALLMSRGANARLLNAQGLDPAAFARNAGRDSLGQRIADSIR